MQHNTKVLHSPVAVIQLGVMIAVRGCRPLTEQEVRRTIAAFAGPWASRNRAWYVLGYRAGFRVSEQISLRVGDVLSPGRGGRDEPITPADLRGVVTVPRRRMKGKRQGRSVPLHGEARDVLAAWLEEIRQRGLLTADMPLFYSRKRRRRAGIHRAPKLPFPDAPETPESSTGLKPVPPAAGPTEWRPISREQAWRIEKAAYAAAGIWDQTGTHSKRKTFAREVLSRAKQDPAVDEPLLVVKEALGHVSLDSTQRYLGVAQDAVRRAILGDDAN